LVIGFIVRLYYNYSWLQQLTHWTPFDNETPTEFLLDLGLVSTLLLLSSTLQYDSFLCLLNFSPSMTSGELYRKHRLQEFSDVICISFATVIHVLIPK
jgi:hypothetical protein